MFIGGNLATRTLLLGGIAELLIYRTALTADDVSSIYKLGFEDISIDLHASSITFATVF